MSHPQGPNTGSFGQPEGQPGGQPEGQPQQQGWPQPAHNDQGQQGRYDAAPSAGANPPQTGGFPSPAQHGSNQPAPQQGWGQPAPQPQQSWGQPAGGAAWGQQGGAPAKAAFNPATVSWWRWAGLGLWLVAVIGLSLNYITLSFNGGASGSYGTGSSGASGWNSGLNVLMFILLLLGAGAIAVTMFLDLKVPFPVEWVVGGLFALAALLGILEFLVNISDLGSAPYGGGVSVSYGVGAYICLAVALAAGAVAAMEIIAALKAPKTSASAGAGQWGQPATGQWGQPGSAPQQQWNQPGQPAAQQQYGYQQPPQQESQPGYQSPQQESQPGYQPEQQEQRPGQPGEQQPGQWPAP
ncbi:MAG: hypothetical protein ABI137_12125 [Antricoccus sp.]